MIACVLCAFAAAAGGPPAELDLKRDANVVIHGARPEDQAGTAIAPAGDVNGDGVDDVIITAPLATARGRLQSGAAYVLFGRESRARLRRQALDGHGFRIVGPDGTGFGRDAAGIGDVNGDGLDDVVVTGGPSISKETTAWIVFGRRGGSTVDAANLGAQGVRVVGPPSLMWSAAGGKDVDGDGRPDVVFASMWSGSQAYEGPGSVHVLRGGLASGAVDLREAGGHTYEIKVNNYPDSVALVDDMTGDGRAEIAIAASPGGGWGSAGPLPTPGGPIVRVVFGRAATTQLDLRGGTGDAGFDVASGLVHWNAIRGGGDVDGDGRGDLVIGGQGDGRRAVVVLGAASTEAVDTSRPGPRVVHLRLPRRERTVVASITGDLDGDGLDDVVLGASDADGRGRREAGAVYVVPGSRAARTVELARLRGRGLRIVGAAPREGLGFGVASAGDFNDDGRADLLLSAASRRVGPANIFAYIVYGSKRKR